METMRVRLKPYDPRRGFVLQRYTYRGIKIHHERGWERVPKDVAEYLKTVHELPDDPHSPLAFDVCTDAEAAALEARQESEARVRRSATDDVPVSLPRPAPPPPSKGPEEPPKEGGRPEEPKPPRGEESKKKPGG